MFLFSFLSLQFGLIAFFDSIAAFSPLSLSLSHSVQVGFSRERCEEADWVRARFMADVVVVVVVVAVVTVITVVSLVVVVVVVGEGRGAPETQISLGPYHSGSK